MFIELLKTRRSIRRYQDRPLEKEKLETILKSALLSPSSRGTRPWQFDVVTDRAALMKLAACKEHGSAFLKGAAAAVVVLADTAACEAWVEDASIASVIMQLTAHALGVGSCWIQVRGRQHSRDVKAEDYVRDALGVPEEYAVESIIAFGYADEPKTPHPEPQLPHAKVHFESYGR
jgi:nitroreductase